MLAIRQEGIIVSDRDVINRKMKEFLSGEKVDATEMSVVFVYLLKMRSTLRIMEDLLEDIAYWQENGNLAKRNFEIENLEINLKLFVEVLSNMIRTMNGEEVNEESEGKK